MSVRYDQYIRETFAKRLNQCVRHFLIHRNDAGNDGVIRVVPVRVDTATGTEDVIGALKLVCATRCPVDVDHTHTVQPRVVQDQILNREAFRVLNMQRTEIPVPLKDYGLQAVVVQDREVRQRRRQLQRFQMAAVRQRDAEQFRSGRDHCLQAGASAEVEHLLCAGAEGLAVCHVDRFQQVVVADRDAVLRAETQVLI